ncbi:glycosyltransferase family 4 protein [Epilithonimonas mollis]|uniref:Glycosyltransferase involved in cell wall bisynthesis n=1 Tax=Epilithonimonas mollis TaxID=216903 RepID=A0A1M6PJS7_9FLAO|nr:glycosyltransferase family 1 protein [Epilithonimonas mollis]SHK08180.1 Glycosyltransferase involved in cell wall bisynthesis [Epilithonimonas mollis]
MKILVDPQIFSQQTYGGISRYYTEIFSEIKKRKDIQVILPIYYTDNFYLKTTDLLSKNKLLTSVYDLLSFFKISTKTLRRKKTEKFLTQVCQGNNYDVFVPTYYNPYFLDLITEKPFVLTVYDMIHELFPQYFSDDPYRVTENKKKLIYKATRIIAVSHNTKKDILAIFPDLDPEKIHVIHHGSSIKIDVNTKVNLPANYILYVGSRADYKNFKLLVNAINPILKENPDLVLLAAGGGEFSEEEINFIQKLDLGKQIKQTTFEENELGHFYKNAEFFVFPSQYEGFGIPVLESMACGCPIILSDSGSFPEVAGDAGIYFDSMSEDDLRTKIKMLLDDEDMRTQFSGKGLEQVKKFDWKVAAEQCLEVYRGAIEDKKNEINNINDKL